MLVKLLKPKSSCLSKPTAQLDEESCFNLHSTLRFPTYFEVHTSAEQGEKNRTLSMRLPILAAVPEFKVCFKNIQVVIDHTGDKSEIEVTLNYLRGKIKGLRLHGLPDKKALHEFDLNLDWIGGQDLESIESLELYNCPNDALETLLGYHF